MKYAIRLHTETETPDGNTQDYWVTPDGLLTTNKDEAKFFQTHAGIPEFQATLPYRTKIEAW